jgi:hypothetical protein
LDSNKVLNILKDIVDKIVVNKYDFSNETEALKSTKLGSGILDAGQVGAREKRTKKREMELKKKKANVGV